MAMAAYLRITKGMQRKTKENCGMVGNWTWKQGIIPAIKQDIVELFPGSRADQSRVFVSSTQSQESWGHCLGTVYQLARLMINGLEASEE